MTEEIKKFRPYIAIHPGEHLSDILDGAAMSQKELAERMGIAKETVNDIIKGRNPITPETAIKLERVFGISATFWNNLQNNYKETLAYLEDQKSLMKESEIAKKYDCYNQLAKSGAVKITRDWAEKAKELMKFFSVSSLINVSKIESVAFRKCEKENLSNECLATWLRWGELQATDMKLPIYDEKNLRGLINEFRRLTSEKPEDFSRQLKKLCMECGVALVFTPYISKTYANGATRWLDSGNPIIQISLRNRYTDIFWFTFFHELGHILKHGKKDQYVEIDDGESSDLKEKEADEFACNTLIPENDYKKFIESEIVTIPRVIQFAKNIGVSADIVAGRIGHDYGCWEKIERLRTKLMLASEK